MKDLYKISLLTVAAICLAAPAYAEGYSTSDRNTQSRSGSNMNTENSYNQDTMNNSRMNSSERMGSQQRTNTQQDYNSSGQTASGTQYSRLSNSDVMSVQQNLRNEGYSLSVDGVWGPQTTQAIRSFQRDNNLNATGNLDPRTLAELDVNVNGSRSE